jgi:acyl-CoA dehydrogenase
VLKDYRPDQGLWPSYHLPALKEAAHDKYAKELDEVRAEYAKSKAREAATA